jgi:hypothetical protein
MHDDRPAPHHVLQQILSEEEYARLVVTDSGSAQALAELRDFLVEVAAAGDTEAAEILERWARLGAAPDCE